jgi:hypothetical protein
MLALECEPVHISTIFVACFRMRGWRPWKARCADDCQSVRTDLGTGQRISRPFDGASVCSRGRRQNPMSMDAGCF